MPPRYSEPVNSETLRRNHYHILPYLELDELFTFKLPIIVQPNGFPLFELWKAHFINNISFEMITRKSSSECRFVYLKTLYSKRDFDFFRHRILATEFSQVTLAAVGLVATKARKG